MKETLMMILFFLGGTAAFIGLIKLFVEVNRWISTWMGLM